MKQKDITLIVAVVIVSAIISFIVSGQLITSPNNRQEKVEVVEPITAQFPEPDERYFNEQSINPTLLIQIGDDPNQQPFRQ